MVNSIADVDVGFDPLHRNDDFIILGYLCHYARIAIQLEQHTPELFRMIEKVLRKGEK